MKRTRVRIILCILFSSMTLASDHSNIDGKHQYGTIPEEEELSDEAIEFSPMRGRYSSAAAFVAASIESPLQLRQLKNQQEIMHIQENHATEIKQANFRKDCRLCLCGICYGVVAALSIGGGICLPLLAYNYNRCH